MYPHLTLGGVDLTASWNHMMSNIQSVISSQIDTATIVIDDTTGSVDADEEDEVILNSIVDDDFGNWTEVEAGATLSQTATVSTFTAVTGQEVSYLYTDRGAGFFSDDIDILFSLQVTSASADGGWIRALSFGNALGAAPQYPSIGVQLWRDGAAYKIVLDEYYISSSYTDTYTCAAATPYYCRLLLARSVGIYGTLYLYIYSDPERATLVATKTLTLHSTESYRYMIAPQSRNVAVAATITGWVSGLTDNRLFAGYVKVNDLGLTGITKRWVCGCQDYTSLLDKTLINAVYTAQTDKAIIQAAFAAELAEITSATFVDEGETIALLACNRWTLRQLMDYLALNSGFVWWVDYSKRLHYTATTTNVAPWSLNSTPNNLTSHPFKMLTYPKDSTELVNWVYVVGAPGIFATVESAASQAAYGRTFEGVIFDSDIEATADATLRGDVEIAEKAYAREQGTLLLWKDGLKAGQYITIVDVLRSINGAYVIQRLSTNFLGNKQAQYEMSFGKYEPDLVDLLIKLKQSTKAPPAVEIGYLTVAIFRANQGQGTNWDHSPEYLNDGDEATVASTGDVNDYITIYFPSPMYIQQWRQYGHVTNIGDGVAKLQYMDWDDAWQDWEVNVGTTGAAWAGWSVETIYIAKGIRLVATTIDSEGDSHFGELEVKY